MGRPGKRINMADTPKLFRVMLQVSDLDEAIHFYCKLLDTPGRPLRGSRAYFDCGSVILAILDPNPGGIQPKPNVDDVYFSVTDIEGVHARARELGCLSKEEVHDQNAGDIVTRSWGERSFYIEDPWGNGFCLVDEKTLFTGR
jgi:catechol 2,3-dioxygenase-like lactoylglutathione lyase family enzyme